MDLSLDMLGKSVNLVFSYIFNLYAMETDNGNRGIKTTNKA